MATKQSTTKNMQDHARNVLRHQQEAQAAAGPRVVAHEGGPKGRKLARNLGHGLLRPDIGKEVRRTDTPAYCGTITALVSDYVQGPNKMDPNRISTRFVGEFMLVTYDGDVLTGAECFLPSAVELPLIASLKARGPQGEPIQLSVEVWCEPTEKSPVGYAYATYDRKAVRGNDPLMALAYEAGILERPAAALPAPSESRAEDVDPETGEIGSAGNTASAA